MQSLPTQMSHDYVTWLMSSFPETRTLDGKVMTRVREMIHLDSFTNTLPQSELERIDRIDDAYDLAWALALEVWVAVNDKLFEQHIEGGVCDVCEVIEIRDRKVQRGVKVMATARRIQATPTLDVFKKLQNLTRLVPGLKPIMQMEVECPVCANKRYNDLARDRVRDMVNDQVATHVMHMYEQAIMPLYQGPLSDSHFGMHKVESESFGLAAFSAVKRLEVFLALVEQEERAMRSVGLAITGGAGLGAAVSSLPASILPGRRSSIFNRVASKMDRAAAMAWLTGSVSISVCTTVETSILQNSLVTVMARTCAERCLLNSSSRALVGLAELEVLIGGFMAIVEAMLNGDERSRALRGI
jgi:hypothetical protein